MEFANEMQKNVHTMLSAWFADGIKAGQVHAVPDRPVFLINRGSALVHVMVNPMGEKEAAITVGAHVVTGAKITPELMAFLLAHNASALIGAFGVHPETGTITCDHSIIGSTCDQVELFASISFVSEVADKYDDVIIEKFGGKSGLAVATGR
jgi:hypothetical protein